MSDGGLCRGWMEELEELGAGSPRFLESSRKTSHIVSHSCLMSAMSFSGLAWKGGVWRK